MLLSAATASLGQPPAGRPGSEEPKAVEKPPVEDLGNGRYRVGAIDVDKPAGRFRVPATVLRDEPPLEFLAATRGGFKSYESLLELQASAYEFNLACILVGLDAEGSTPARHHFDPEPPKGDLVEIWVTWKKDEEEKRAFAGELIQVGGKTSPPSDWVYTGSIFTPDGRYLAHLDGTAIGLVHDPSSIIEHRTGIGLGAFGTVEANRALLPPVGTSVTLVVEKRAPPPEGEAGAPARPPAP